MDYNSDFRYDLETGILDGETWFHELLTNKKVEVKYDKLGHKTGNIYIEYESRGKPSGIAITKADFYAYRISNSHLIVIEVSELKSKLKHLVSIGKARANVKGGDNNTSLGVLVSFKDLF